MSKETLRMNMLAGIITEKEYQAKLNESIDFKGKIVDESSLEVDGVDTEDYPDFSDAYFSYGTFEDGTELTDQQLEELISNYPDLLHDKIIDTYL